MARNMEQRDGAGPTERRCDQDGCHEAGTHRAPRSRDNLRDYYWFCLEHVREYNAAWNYYAGMSEDQVERERRRDTIWHRPTWPLRGQGERRVEDPFETGAGASAAQSTVSPEQAAAMAWSAADRAALAVLGLRPPVTVPAVKKRYKELAKRHHPDANGGDKAAEETFKAINLAYARLSASRAGQP